MIIFLCALFQVVHHQVGYHEVLPGHGVNGPNDSLNIFI